MGVDYYAFSCIGYEVESGSFYEKIDNSDTVDDIDDIEAELRLKYGEDLSIVNAGNHYSDDLKLFIFFAEMFVDGIYQLSKQKQLRQLVENENIEVIGVFGSHEEQCVS